MGALGAAEDTDRDDWDDLELSYHTVRPNKWTFQSTKIRRWVESRLQGRVLNACAGKTKLANDHEIVRNDLDESRDADLHVDVCEIAAAWSPPCRSCVTEEFPLGGDDVATDGGQDLGDAMFPGLDDRPFSNRPEGGRCEDCERLQHPDREECPVCGGDLVARD
jgi:hypothetical protein